MGICSVAKTYMYYVPLIWASALPSASNTASMLANVIGETIFVVNTIALVAVCDRLVGIFHKFSVSDVEDGILVFLKSLKCCEELRVSAKFCTTD